MSDKPIDDGGPAFSRSGAEFVSPAQDGMSLRDYFASKALQMIVINDVTQRPEDFRKHYSEGAYKWADAMLQARKEKS